MTLLFWSASLLILYVYLGYPGLIAAVARRSRVRPVSAGRLPTVTVIVAAHNEEQVLSAKLENVLAQGYPKDHLQIVVASDASTDRTNEIARSFAARGVQLYDQKEHLGKSAALNHVVERLATGTVLVFNDATAMLEPGALERIVAPLSDPGVGAVAGRLVWRSPEDTGNTRSFGLYWRYEEFLRKAESGAGVLPFVSGAFYAIRRSLYTPTPPTLPDDSVSPLGVYAQGFAVRYAEEAVAIEEPAVSQGAEFRIKSRGVVRELGSIARFRRLLNPLRHPRLALVLVSHRLLRWSVPVWLLALLAANLTLLDRPLYRAVFTLQLAFYALAAFGLLFKPKARLFSLPSYFSLVNAAALLGLLQFLTGRSRAVWRPAR